jgi:hypothetical protein
MMCRTIGLLVTLALSLKDRSMLGRLGEDVGHYVYMCSCRIRYQRRRAYGDAVYVLGILSGAIQWFLTQRRTR